MILMCIFISVCSCSVCIYSGGDTVFVSVEIGSWPLSWLNQLGTEPCWLSLSPLYKSFGRPSKRLAHKVSLSIRLLFHTFQASRLQQEVWRSLVAVPALFSAGTASVEATCASRAQNGNRNFRWDVRTRGCLMLQPARVLNTFRKQGVQPSLSPRFYKTDPSQSLLRCVCVTCSCSC